MNYARAVGDALRGCLADDERVVLLGEDIADPYGGAFKVSRGLSTAFPERVRTTPISEAALAGLSAGLALEGFRPIVEIMFGDFLTLTFDQIVNHISKYPAMYDGQVSCPVVVRTPSGGGRGYGPTHSQSLEKHFLGVPHLRVVAPSLVHDPAAVFRALLAQDDAALVIEHKLLYPMTVPDGSGSGADDDGRWSAALDGEGVLAARGSVGPSGLQTVALSAVPPEDCVATVVAYGHAAVLAARVAARLAMEEEVFVDVVIPAQIDPPDWDPIDGSVAATGALVTVEEGTAGWSWGTGVAGHVVDHAFDRLRRPPQVVTSARAVIPSARDLEDDVLVGTGDVEQAIRAVA